MHANTIANSSPVPLSEWELQSQIQQALSSGLTGQIQVAFLNGRTESIFVQHGVVQTLYVRNHRLPNLEWQVPLEHHGVGVLTVESLPGRALMFRKVVTEEIVQPPAQPSETRQLHSLFNRAEHSPNPTLFHIRWQTAEAFTLIAGVNIPIRHTVLITPVGVEVGNVALDRILDWDETDCSVMIHHSDIKNQAWTELYLNILLEWYAQKILSHYQQLTGVVMVKSILQSLSVVAENKGWDISTQHQQLRDTSIFPSAAVTANAYREIFSTIRSRIEPIIGGSLTGYIFKQSIEPTRGIYKIIQENFGLVEDAQ